MNDADYELIDEAFGHMRNHWWKYLITVLLFAGLVMCMWQAHWWFFAQSVNRTSRIMQGSQGAQLGFQTAVSNDVAQVDQDVSEVPGSPDPASLWLAARAAGNAACRQAENLDGQAMSVPADMQHWIAGNCYMGQLSASSPVVQKKGNGGQ